MNKPTRLIINFSIFGIVIGVICGISAYSFGVVYMKEPPPYAVMLVTVVITVIFAVQSAYAAGLKDATTTNPSDDD